MALVTAEKIASLWQIGSTWLRDPESGPNRQGPVGRKRTIKLEGMRTYASLLAKSGAEMRDWSPAASEPLSSSCSAAPEE